MYHIIFSIIFSFIISQSIQTAAEQINVAVTQPYTAQQHFQDIKDVLLSTKYTMPTNRRELRSNAQMNRFIKFLNEVLQTEEPLFIERALPFVIEVINQKALVIPQGSKDQFKEKVKILLEKRTNALLKI